MNSILTFLTSAMKPKGPHEFAGACPQCGGEDRFIVWPDRPRGGAYLCRGCGSQGDGIQFMREFMGMSYPEACAALGLEQKHTTTSLLSARRTHVRPRPAHPLQMAHVPPKPEPGVLPCREWMSSAAAFLAECQRGLETIPEALLAICGRFLTPHTAQDCGIGWNPADRYILRESWDLPVVELAGGGKRDKLLLPRGLVIATRRKAGTVALTVRCADDRPESRPKYWQVQGSSNVPFVAGRAELPLLLVESALDAALVWQESFGKLAAVALMGNMKGLDSDTHAFIQAAPLLLACPDNDEGGQVAWQRWSAAYPQAILTPAVGAKDLGDMHRAALTWPINPDIPSVMEWVPDVLAFASRNSTTYALAA
ncbi:zinc-binding protein [Desulfovibrio sp. UIB00]|uniref:primase-helicase zinc-binding domain-containing protein n=1 Tax=Desulfovibrio sp. UIB00 TaxID=2804314 RepID=UPI001F106293|nr:primase-helicase zinc-binding domain-containing protein [Desulfovibrio sp. UIB00]MCH5146062.1 zinc-binding protein [Desulfovibrio sp. UIB00]